jgi:hypothetical protein
MQQRLGFASQHLRNEPTAGRTVLRAIWQNEPTALLSRIELELAKRTHRGANSEVGTRPYSLDVRISNFEFPIAARWALLVLLFTCLNVILSG